jgi:hypothetical protein
MEGFAPVRTASTASTASTATATGVTRAADCNCLPGYIPSKSSGYGGEIFNSFSSGNHYVFNPRGTKDMYVILPDNNCGMPIGQLNEPPNPNYKTILVDDVFRLYNFKGELPCNLVKKDLSTSYFCKNLTDPSKIRKCY